jgi:hypothetical protein
VLDVGSRHIAASRLLVERPRIVGPGGLPALFIHRTIENVGYLIGRNARRPNEKIHGGPGRAVKVAAASQTKVEATAMLRQAGLEILEDIRSDPCWQPVPTLPDFRNILNQDRRFTGIILGVYPPLSGK